MPGTFSPPPRISDPDMHHGKCVTHVLWCMPGSLTRGFLRGRWRGKRSRHCRRLCNPQSSVSGKRPIAGATNLILVMKSLQQIWRTDTHKFCRRFHELQRLDLKIGCRNNSHNKSYQRNMSLFVRENCNKVEILLRTRNDTKSNMILPAIWNDVARITECLRI